MHMLRVYVMRVVGPVKNDGALFHHDLSRHEVLHQPQPVRDQQDASGVLVEFIQRIRQPVLMLEVHARNGLVEDQHIGFPRESARDEDPLLLTTREAGDRRTGELFEAYEL